MAINGTYLGEGYQPEEEPGRSTYDNDHDDDDEGVPFELEDLSVCCVYLIHECHYHLPQNANATASIERMLERETPILASKQPDCICGNNSKEASHQQQLTPSAYTAGYNKPKIDSHTHTRSLAGLPEKVRTLH